MSDRGIVVAMSKWAVRGVSGVIKDDNQISVDHCLLSDAFQKTGANLPACNNKGIPLPVLMGKGLCGVSCSIP